MFAVYEINVIVAVVGGREKERLKYIKKNQILKLRPNLFSL